MSNISLTDGRIKKLVEWLNTFFPSGSFSASKLICKPVAFFMDTEKASTLEICLFEQEPRLRCTNAVVFPKNCLREVYLVKVKKAAVTLEGMYDEVRVGSFLKGPVENLSLEISFVYAPLFSLSDTWGHKLNEKLKSVLVGLDDALRSEAPVAEFTSPITEVEYYRRLSQKKAEGHIMVSAFNKHISWEDTLEEGTFFRRELEDLVRGQAPLLDKIEECLHHLWESIRNPKHQYPEERMRKLLTSLSHHFYRFVAYRLASLTEGDGKSLWTVPYVSIKDALECSVEIFARWTRFVDSCTKSDGRWIKCTVHKWSGQPHIDSISERTIKRLKEIMQVRKTNEKIFQIMEVGEEERREYYEKFTGSSPLSLNLQASRLWSSSLRSYNEVIKKEESEIGKRLIVRLKQYEKNPHRLLTEYKRVSILLLRKNIFAMMKETREKLVELLKRHLREELLQEFVVIRSESEDGEAGGEKASVETLMKSVVLAKNVEEKVYFVYLNAKTVLHDLESFKLLVAQIQKVLKKIKEYVKQQLTRWAKKMSEVIKKSELTLKGVVKIDETDLGPRMRIECDNDLFEPMEHITRLSSALKEFPPQFVQAGKRYRQFHGFIAMLRQLANFVNGVYEQVIPTTVEMLKESSIQFERVIYNFESNEARVKNPKECHKFIHDLKKAGVGLFRENQVIFGVHRELSDLCVELININLLNSKTAWVEKFGQVKKIVDGFDSRGYKYMDSWKKHWDHQIYKCCEFQYQSGLERLNENLEKLKVRLVFQNKRLQYQPSLANLRETYFSKMRDFISFPGSFEGLSKQVNFSVMVKKNSRYLRSVYQKAYILFNKLELVRRKYSSQTLLGKVHLEEVIEANFKDVRSWERTFVLVEQKRRQIRQIKDVVSIDCIDINLEDFKLKLEDQLSKLHDVLVGTLTFRTRAHLTNITTYIEDSEKLLDREPRNLDEVTQCTDTMVEVMKSKALQEGEFEAFDRKNLALRYIARQGIDHMASEVKDQWYDFDEKIRVYQRFLTQKMEGFKKDVESRLTAFRIESAKFEKRWKKGRPELNMSLEGRALKKHADAEVDRLDEYRQEYNFMMTKRKNLEDKCKLFDILPTHFQTLDQVGKEVAHWEKVWLPYSHFYGEINKFQNEQWMTFKTRLHKFDEFVENQNELLSKNPDDPLCRHLVGELKVFAKFQQYSKFILGVGWTAEHWLQFGKIIGAKKLTIDNLKFGLLIDKADVIVTKLSEIKKLNAQALGEDQIRKALYELKVWENTHEFEFLEHVDSKKPIFLVKEWKDVMSKVGDNYSLLTSLKDSSFISIFSVEVSSWEQKILRLDEYLRMLVVIQRKWVYLSPIFERGALPSQQAKFNRADSVFREIMGDIHDEKRVVKITKFDLSERLKRILTQLDSCQRALNDFLEEKRQAFPRFYFIGDEDLLQILGQAQNPRVIQSHLKKLFAGINKVVFDEEGKQILEMCSGAKEHVKLHDSVEICEAVEDWLGDLDRMMKKTLKLLIRDCVLEVRQRSLEDPTILNKYPEQVLSVATNIIFCEECEAAIPQKRLGNLLQKTKGTLAKYTQMDRKGNHLLDIKLKSLMYDITHNVDVIEHCIAKKVSRIDEWNWQKQLRFYLDGEGTIMRMSFSQFDYSYEYHGNKGKLVYTPLTDKCYLTLTQALYLGFGGNPYGPAGTGKTESVKALGVLFGRQVMVFNCDEGIDFQSMGRIFIGLVRCGAWGCFDEFNRLLEDQLSTISQQIQIIQAALKQRKPKIDLLGLSIQVDFNAGIFVTMNPVSKKYGARSKLPGNLKQLFRPVAMSRPNIDLIARVMLFCEGFKKGDILSKKMVAMFNLCKERLSPQQHYDWGLRAMKTIMRIGGGILKKTHGDEQNILIQAIRVNTVPKLTHQDSRLFTGIMTDVFPGAEYGDIEHKDLEKRVKEVLANEGLCEIGSQIHKLMQFYEALGQRMGVVLVGPSGSGKTTVWEVLFKALILTGRKMKKYVVNPKSISREKLLGHMEEDTREFFDGIITANSRAVVLDPLDITSWIVLDGDIDPKWVEALNSVLDDNKLLTMPTGERIQFGDNVNFVFETHSLRYASPATVSRLGMIFLSENDMDLKKFVAAWVRRKKKKHLANWLSSYFFKCLRLIRDDFKPVVDSTLVGITSCALTHLINVKTKGEFVIGLVRGFGSYLVLEERIEFAKQVFDLCGEKPIDYKRPLDCYYSNSEDKILPFEFSSGDLTFEMLFDYPVVRTVEVQRTLAVIEHCVENTEPFLMVAPEGCGVTMLLNDCMRNIRSRSSVAFTTVYCNSSTSSKQIIRKLMQFGNVLNQQDGKTLVPKDADLLVVYVRDLNIPKPDKYGTTQLVSFIQQLIAYNGFYDHQLDWIALGKVEIVCSMKPVDSPGTHPVSPRLLSVLRVLYLPYPDHNQLTTVYTEVSQTVLRKAFPRSALWNKRENAQRFVETILDVYQGVRDSFSIDTQSHYLFNPRDLTNWILGIFRYELASQEGEEKKMDDLDLLHAMVYEGRRIFRDKLATPKEVKKYLEIEAKSFKRFSKEGFSIEKKKNFFYSTLTKVGCTGQLRGNSLKDMAELAQNKIHHYERVQREIRVPVLTETIRFICQVDRELSREGGALLLCGRPGLGRKNLLLVVSHARKLTVMSPRTILGYNLKKFLVDLKEACRVAGVENHPVCFFCEDHLLPAPVIECINGVLNGEYIEIFQQKEELDQFLQPIGEEMSTQGEFGNPYTVFEKRMRKNLRVVLSLDPTNPRFGDVTHANPALFTRCAVAWKVDWEPAGYLRIPRVLVDKDVLKCIPGDAANNVKLLAKLHRSVPWAVPTHFVEFLDCFADIVGRFEKGKLEELKHLTNGLEKITETEQKIAQMSEGARQKKIQLDEKKAEAKIAMNSIQSKMKQSIEEQSRIGTLKETIEVENENISVKSERIAQDLKSVQPLLAKAKKAVSNIDNKDLVEIRSYAMPKQEILDVFCGVVLLMGRKDTRLKAMKKFLGESGVKNSIINLDPRTVSNKTFGAVKKHMAKTKDAFENIHRISKVAETLAIWLTAIMQYMTVLKKVGPWERELDKLRKKNAALEKQMIECEEKLKKLEDSVQDLQNEFEEKTTEAAALKSGLEKVEKKLNQAQSLLGKLTDEKERWEIQRAEKEKQTGQVPFMCVLSSAFITYLGGRAEDERRKFVGNWINLFALKDFIFDLRGFLSSESDMLQFSCDGLPGDKLSQENAIVIINSKQYPLIVDPSQQAVVWLKNHHHNKVVLTNTSDSKFSNQLELAVRFGKIIIISEVDHIPPVLFPLLKGEMFTQGTRKSLTIGEKVVDFNVNFKLYLVTRDPKLELPPDAEACVNRINFTVTRSGLVEQLLSKIFNEKYPELESRKKKLLREEEDLKLSLLKLEDRLLDELANSTGSVLENVELIESLNGLKKNSAKVKAKLAQFSEIKKDLEMKQNKYRVLAETASTVFFLLQDLPNLHPMYHFSLEKFLSLYAKAIKTPTEDVGVLIETLVVLVYNKVSRAIFKNDRLIFALHLVHGLERDNEYKISDKEWSFFLGSHAAHSKTKPTIPNWLPKHRHRAFTDFSSAFPEQIKVLQGNAEVWKKWTKLEHFKGVPAQFEKTMTPFQQQLIIQTVRPDQLYSCLSIFACAALGIKSVSPPPLNFGVLYKEETIVGTDEPVLMITTPGTDPSLELEEMAKRTVGTKAFHQLAMGQGVQDRALRMVEAAAEKGEWVYLKNLHLVIAWVPQLEKELSMLQNVKPSFRLWLSTEPHHRFSVILLNKSLKITFESPPGIKQNLLKTLASWHSHDSGEKKKGGEKEKKEEDMFGGGKNPIRGAVMFSLACFHAVIQERRTYVPQGWSKFYEITPADLRGAGDILVSSIGKGKVDWETVHGIFENVLYGGRMDRIHDVNVLKAYLRKMLSPAALRGKVELLQGLSAPKDARGFTIDMAVENVNKSLADNDPPTIFGLSLNADRVLATLKGEDVTTKLQLLSISGAAHGKEEGGGGAVNEKVLQLVRYWQKLISSNVDILFNKKKETDESKMDPIVGFVVNEFVNACSLVKYLNVCFQELEECARGKKIMTPALKSIRTNLLVGAIPSPWDDRWEDGPKKVMRWLAQVVSKTLALAKLSKMKDHNTMFLSHLFQPNIFLNAFKQKVARETKTALDELTHLSVTWMEKGSSSVWEGIALRGLFIQGAGMRGEKLLDVPGDSPSLRQAGTCAINWVKKKKDTSVITLPIYFTPNKERILTNLYVPCNTKHKERWILKGVAFFANE